MLSRQFHSYLGLANGQSSTFARELRNYSQNLKAFAGRVPCNNWTLRLQRKWHCRFGKLRNFSNWRIKMYLLVSLNITRNIVNVWKNNLSEYLLAEFV